MTLTDRITEDLKNAMRSGEKVRLETLRMLRASLIQLQKSGKEVTPSDELRAVQKQASARKDAIEQFGAANRPDRVEQETAELRIIEEYLPTQLSDDEIREEVRRVVAETGAAGMNDFKSVMPKAAAAMRDRAAGNRIQAIVREELQAAGEKGA